jgi:hypothetical protein
VFPDGSVFVLGHNNKLVSNSTNKSISNTPQLDKSNKMSSIRINKQILNEQTNMHSILSPPKTASSDIDLSERRDKTSHRSHVLTNINHSTNAKDIIYSGISNDQPTNNDNNNSNNNKIDINDYYDFDSQYITQNNSRLLTRPKSTGFISSEVMPTSTSMKSTSKDFNFLSTVGSNVISQRLHTPNIKVIDHNEVNSEISVSPKKESTVDEDFDIDKVYKRNM